MYDINEQEYQAVTALDAAERYSYSLKRIADREQVWSLRSPDGWVLAGDDQGHEVVPIWPHPRFAESCAIEQWHDSIPCSISLQDWIDKWLPGLERDGRFITVFPTHEQRGMVATPTQLREDLINELEQYE